MKKNQLFKDLEKGLKEAIDYEGGKLDLRSEIVEHLSEPPVLSKTKIKRIREKVLGMSQPVFAKLLGVSPSAVKAWEQGLKTPSGSARRLLQMIERRPDIIKEMSV